jgi:hypothetical protein
MSFNLNDSTKKSKDTLQYNYYNTLLGSQEKNVQSNGYLKYDFSNSISTSFSNPNLSLKGHQYISDKLYVFNRFYNIQNTNYDGMLIIENKPIDNNINSNIFTIFLLKTNPNILSNEIDGLFDRSVSSLKLNGFITNQPSIVFENVVLFTLPISIHNNFNHFITPQFVSVGLLNAFTNNYTIMNATHFNIEMEGFAVNVDTIDQTDLTNEVSCQASDEVTGADISQVAMVPVDSDFLNGVYQITMMRTLFDIFIFIVIFIVCVFVSPPIYKYLVIDFLEKKYTRSQDIRNKIMYFLDITTIVLLLFAGLTLTIDGVQTTNGTEMVIGIYSIIILVFSVCAIRYNKTVNWGLQNTPFTLPGITELISFLGWLTSKDYGKYIFWTFLLSMIACLMAWLINYIILKNITPVSWMSFLLLIVPIFTFIMSYVVLVIYEMNKTTVI